ncbi:MAG TPA: NAD(P)/FAD-dependent oxidoreductase [Tissierellia bacterium]|nr:NAD(P)/FAD-dependent oxidoreductase [Tissierellia bacterium]
MIKTDILIIGAGIIGASIARECSKYQLDVIVLDKNNEAAQETSKANSGIVHAGYDPLPGTLKAKLNKRGSELYRELHQVIDIPYEPIGSLVLARNEDEKLVLNHLYLTGLENGVTDLHMLDADQTRELEPQVSDAVVASLHAPGAAIICPFNATFAFLESAMLNGVAFYPRQEVKRIRKEHSGFLVETKDQTYHCLVLINAAGAMTGALAKELGDSLLSTHIRRGEYRVLDLSERVHYHQVLFQLPSKYSKGILVTPTVHGNVLLGPTSILQDSKQDTSVTAEGLEEVDSQLSRLIRKVRLDKTIRVFTGLRSTSETGDFDIRRGESGAYHLNGIDSPGLASAPAIAEYVLNMIRQEHQLIEKTDFIPERRGITLYKDLPHEEQLALMRQNPDYGDVVCRCEDITLADIKQAIEHGATTIGGVKRRVRPGSGRCQGGFCEHRVLQILAQELGVGIEEIEKERPGSWMVIK